MATPDTSRPEAETDALSSLEERILRAVDLIGQLRTENEAIHRQLQADSSERESAAVMIAGLRSENQQLKEELESLRAERKQVRTRIEKLLGQMDLLAT